MNNYFIILASGQSKRFNSKKPKQYNIYEGKPLFRHSLDKALKSKLFKKIIIVVNDKKKEAEQLIAREESTKSEAIISLLVNNEFKGFLFFESVDQSTFSVDQSTDYLEFFAQVISKHLQSLLYR